MDKVKCNCPELGDDGQPFFCGQVCDDKGRIARVEKWIDEHLTEANEGSIAHDPDGNAWKLCCDGDGMYARLIGQPGTMVSLNVNGLTPKGVLFKWRRPSQK